MPAAFNSLSRDHELKELLRPKTEKTTTVFQLPLSGSQGGLLLTNAHVCPTSFQLPLSGSHK